MPSLPLSILFLSFVKYGTTSSTAVLLISSSDIWTLFQFVLGLSPGSRVAFVIPMIRRALPVSFFPMNYMIDAPPPLSFYRLVNTSEVRGRHSLIQPSFCQHWVFTLQYPTIFQTIFLFVPIYQQPFVAFLGSRYPFLGSTSTQPWLLWPFKKILIPPVITCAGIDVFFLYCINESGKSGPRLSSQYHNLDGFPQTFVC